MGHDAKRRRSNEYGDTSFTASKRKFGTADELQQLAITEAFSPGSWNPAWESLLDADTVPSVEHTPADLSQAFVNSPGPESSNQQHSLDRFFNEDQMFLDDLQVENLPEITEMFGSDMGAMDLVVEPEQRETCFGMVRRNPR